MNLLSPHARGIKPVLMLLAANTIASTSLGVVMAVIWMRLHG